ncbi:MAG: ABC transporter ATP-binding protein [Pirellulales bacterium]|nr:ABC transporter ATP-binding protein [Pirellulales bacterium]
MIATQPMIEFRHLHRSFGKTKAVNDISFCVPRGQVFGYIGPNGAGKTTSMRILATLELPNYGDAFVDGFSSINDPDRVRARLGFMPDSFGVYPNVNVREYLDFFARSYGLRGTDRRRALSRVMHFTQLDQLADKPITGLSKGMKQRLCLGRTIIHDPAVLIMDEPAAGLDPRARIELREMIRQLAADGKTILISSHILSELGEMCDLVGIIEQGRILYVGPPERLTHEQSGDDRRVWIRLRVLGDGGAAAAREWLLATGKIAEVQRSGETLSFALEGNELDEAALLRQLILADFPVVAFGAQKKSLEEVFIQVTKGLVQ